LLAKLPPGNQVALPSQTLSVSFTKRRNCQTQAMSIRPVTTQWPPSETKSVVWEGFRNRTAKESMLEAAEGAGGT